MTITFINELGEEIKLTVVNIAIPFGSGFREDYDASVGAYPTSAGILRGNIFPVSVAGLLDVYGQGQINVYPGALLIAKLDNPGNNSVNWIVKQ